MTAGAAASPALSGGSARAHAPALAVVPQHQARPRARARRVAALLAPASLALAARLVTGPRTVDDAFITFRYARNAAEGLGLVYNPGEWVLGTTTPAWALLLAGAYRLGATDLPAVALALSALLDAASAALLALLAARLGFGWPGAGLVGAAWALNPMSVAYAAGGMETSLFVVGVLGALSLAAARRVTLAAALAGAMMLVRPEGALAAVAVVGWACWQARGLAAGPALAVGAWALAYAAGLTVWYGSPVPQTVLAKQVAYTSEAPWLSGAVLLAQAGLPGWSSFFPSALPIATLAFPISLAGLVGLLGLGMSGARRLPRARTAQLWQPFATFGGLYLAFHVVAGLRGGRLFPWYLVPPIPLYLLAATAGLGGRPRGLPTAAAGLLLLAWQLPAVDWQRPFLPSGFDLRREALYLRVAADLARDLPPDAVVAAPEIGALGYRSGLRILDTVGLVSPVASRYYPLPPGMVEGDNAIPPRLILDRRPDAVVTLDQFARRSLLADAAFARQYRLERTYPAPIWLSQQLLVYRRVAE